MPRRARRHRVEGHGGGDEARLGCGMSSPSLVPVDELTLPPAMAAAFPPSRCVALERARAVDARRYAQTRNHLRGAVSRLSPYLTHGLVSVPEVLEASGAGGGKFEQELAWREFCQVVHEREGRGIFMDRFRAQPRRAPDASPRRMPAALVAGRTGIEALDDAVCALVDTGYVHNHARMWLASAACHVAGADWRAGAAWFYFHLLDGDLASNTLSWQWVAGSGAARPYLADQANLNRFSDARQHGTFLDRTREALLTAPVPEVLRESVELALPATLPDLSPPRFDDRRTLLLYHPWSLDPTWRAAEDAERWLLIEPSLLTRRPWSRARLAWVLAAAGEVPGLRVAVADANDAVRERASAAARGSAPPVRFRAHPAVAHWHGAADPAPHAFAQRWTSPDAPRSFSAFWKRVAPLRG
jgi:deoxyribodipyrimidine photo-lyase